MKRMLLALLTIACLQATAQTAEDIIEKYAANLGGLDAFNKIKTMKMTGSVNAQGGEMPLTISVINGKAARTDVEAMGMQIISVYNNGTGWKQNPFAGAKTPTAVSGAELSELKSQCIIAPTLMNFKALGSKVELSGQEDVEGIKTYVIKLTAKESDRVTEYYIATNDYMLIKSSIEREIQGTKQKIETWYSDLKDFNGLKFYLTKMQKISGQVFQTSTLKTIEMDVPVDEKIFEMPK